MTDETEEQDGEIFYASRLTAGNHLFPASILVTEEFVIWRKRSGFTVDEIHIHISHVASVHIRVGVAWAELLIESTGGTDPIQGHGFRIEDARRIETLVDLGQTALLKGGMAQGRSATQRAVR